MPPTCVRFAPSPTGPAHVGNAYIALFDYAFAKKTGGRFVLRVEDTDRERSRPEHEDFLLRSMKWLGLQWNEGPDVGGPAGPYRQSERREIYAEHAAVLLERGKAFPCFCTQERLAELREEQKAAKSNFGYDGKCKSLSLEEAKRRMEAGEPHVLRLDVPREGQTSFHDLVRGEVVFQNAEIDYQILLKSDGYPTYHLANVVDDRLMGVTHVVRAEDWISSTPKHILLYKAFGWEPPVFVHMPLLRNPDKSKMSKRKNPTSVDWYREQGYLPEALLNFLANMGFSMGGDREIFSLQEFIEEFTWERVGSGAPVFDLRKLEWMNGEYIRMLAPEELARRIREGYLGDRQVDDALLLRIVPMVRERMKTLSEFVPMTEYLFVDEVSPDAKDMVPKKRTFEESVGALKVALEALEGLGDWTAAEIEKTCRAAGEAMGWKARDFYTPLRAAVTGSRVSPPLFESMEILGKEKTLQRVRKAFS